MNYKNKTLTKYSDEELELPFVDSILKEVDDSVANLQLPSPTLRNYYRDEENRQLWILDAIDEATLDIMYKIMHYNKLDKDIPVEKRKPIKIFIDSVGGSVPHTWSIIKAIKMSKTPVWTINWCGCYSAAGDLLASGHHRLAMPGSTVLLHSGSCMYRGNQEMVENAKKYYDSLSKKVNDNLLNDTKIDPKVFKKKAPSDWYLTAEEALENGIIDKIVESFDEIV